MEKEASSQTSVIEDQVTFAPIDLPIPPSLKFLLNASKPIAQHPLTSENYLSWSTKILQLFEANGYSNYLLPNLPTPPATLTNTDGSPITNPAYTQ